MSLSYGHSFKYSEGELRKNQDFMDFNHQQEHNSGLMSYRSAPSSFLDSVLNGHGNGGNGVGSEDLSYFRSLSPEMDTLFSRFPPQTQTNGSASGDSHFHDLKEFGERPAIKQEVIMDSRMVHHNSSPGSGNSLASSFTSMNSPSLEHPMQTTKVNIGNGSNFPRQNSSPPGLFSNLNLDSGLGVMRDVNTFRACNGTNGEASPSSRHVNLSTRRRLLDQIPEMAGASNYDAKDTKRHYISNFTKDYLDDNSLIKTVRDNDQSLFSGFNTSDNQRNRVNGLTHHLSLPKASMEKFLQFQGSVPCKVRAKRGCATHPRSIAERVRRTRISERMRKLQELFPNMDKQINTADMLDVAVEYIKDLQKQVQILSDTRAKCTCSVKQKPCPSPT